MEEDYLDLRETLAAVHQQTRSGRAIGCVPAEGFATTVSTKRGVLFGGAWSEEKSLGDRRWAVGFGR